MPGHPALVLIHAFPLDSRLFDPVRPALSAATTLVTPDLRGFGDGPPLDDTAGPPDIARYAADVAAELDDRGIDRAVVGGVSLGGYVALALARAQPERVAGLVLVDTRAGADDEAARERRAGVAARADAGDIASGADAIAPLVAPEAADDVRAHLASIAGAVPPGTVAWAQRAMAGRPDSTDVLSGVRVPVLVVVGERDAVTPPSAARSMVDAVRLTGGVADYAELPGTGHLSPAEDADGFVATLLEWLGRRF